MKCPACLRSRRPHPAASYLRSARSAQATARGADEDNACGPVASGLFGGKGHGGRAVISSSGDETRRAEIARQPLDSKHDALCFSRASRSTVEEKRDVVDQRRV